MSNKFYLEMNHKSIKTEAICFKNEDKPLYHITRSFFRSFIGRSTLRVYEYVNGGREEERVATIKQPLFPYFFKIKQKISLNTGEKLTVTSGHKEKYQENDDFQTEKGSGVWKLEIEPLGWSTFSGLNKEHHFFKYFTLFDAEDSVLTCKIVEEREASSLYEVEVKGDEDILKCLCIVVSVFKAVINTPIVNHFYTIES